MIRTLLLRASVCGLFAMAAFGQRGGTHTIRPVEIQDVLVNPGIGVQTDGRFDGDVKPPFPKSSLSYFCLLWSALEPEQGKYRWDIIDNALEGARRHNQTLDLRMMPYDDRHPLPEWYRNSGARRANKPTDKDGAIWSPDADDPLYFKYFSALVRGAGARYDGHPHLNSVDISTVGYWGEGWGPYLPTWQRQKELLDVYFEAFKHTPMMANFDEPHALAYAVERGAGWRLDCWGDLGRRGEGMAHMLDLYPEQVVRTGVGEAWRNYPVSLETCGTTVNWKEWNGGYSDQQLQDIFDQALRWHAVSLNLKNTSVPADWAPKFDEFFKKIGYRFVLKKFQYPAAAKAGAVMPVRSWWINKGDAPPYKPFVLALEIGGVVTKTSADPRKWLPGDQIFDANVYVPEGLKPGDYKVRIALLNATTEKPVVKLAIQGLQPDGWYELGDIKIQEQAPVCRDILGGMNCDSPTN
jgi:hypothetical protein